MVAERPCWIFEPVRLMGGATGSAFASTLQATGIAPEAELAREAIQNSCDASREEKRQVKVEFRIVELEGERRTRFIRDLSLESSIGKRIGRTTKGLGIARENCLATPGRPLHLLFVEDYGTVGLHGNPHDSRSHFHRLLLSVGDSTKALADESTGGSYGYGKSALSLNSRLRTIVAYSAFERDSTGATARLMACAYLDAHELDGKRWTGRAWFGVQRTDAHELVVDPLQDEEAHQFAERLGFRSRRNGAYGTSILVVDSRIVDHKPLLESVEEWWWPRIVQEELHVEVVDARGNTHFPQPRQRPDILPFIECYFLAVGRAEPIGPHQKAGKLNRVKGIQIGSYALQLLESETAEMLPENKLGTVALIRQPKMVVQYAPLGRAEPPAVGVFVADKEIDDILKLSEPPNHDRWDHKSSRLEIAPPDEGTAREVVSSVHKRLTRGMRKFQGQQSAPRPRGERRLRFLERELGALFRPLSSDSEGQDGYTEPVEIRFREGPSRQPNGNDLETVARVALRLRPDADEDRVDAIVRVRVAVLEDDKGREGELLPVELATDGAEPEPFDTEPEIEVALSKDRWLALRLRSAPYDPRWSTKVDVEVIPQTGGS